MLVRQLLRCYPEPVLSMRMIDLYPDRLPNLLQSVLVGQQIPHLVSYRMSQLLLRLLLEHAQEEVQLCRLWLCQ